jgi:hypothetical protein
MWLHFVTLTLHLVQELSPCSQESARSTTATSDILKAVALRGLQALFILFAP